MVQDICLIVQRDRKHLEYLDGHNLWSTYKDAWRYSTDVAFAHAEEFGGDVIMVLPSGRQIPVTRADFTKPEE
jgi:hypothetical protein